MTRRRKHVPFDQRFGPTPEPVADPWAKFEAALERYLEAEDRVFLAAMNVRARVQP